MRPGALNDDTSPEIEQRQIDAWRRMSPVDKAALIVGLSQASTALAEAGVRHRHPTASPREVFLRLALLRLGPDLAAKAYPEITTLGLA